MQFFTWKLWEQLNSRRTEVAEKSDEAWSRNCKAYRRQLQPLLARFGERERRFWNGDTYRLHDAYVVRVAFGDAVGADLVAGGRRPWRSSGVIEVAGSDNRTLYILQYGKVQAVDARLREGGWSYGGTVFDTWGYHELTAEGADAFRHSIVFSTGSELSIVFKRFRCTRKRLPTRG